MSTFEWIVSIGGGLIAPFLLVGLIGLMLPRRHEFTRSVALKQSPRTVWEAITNLERIPSWWPPCVAVERLPDKDRRPVYRQTFKHGRRLQPLMLEVIESEAPSRFATKIADVRGPFQGRWVYELKEENGGCRLTLTEHGEIKNPIIRALFRMLMNKFQFVDSYLVCLSQRFGEQVAPA